MSQNTTTGESTTSASYTTWNPNPRPRTTSTTSTASSTSSLNNEFTPNNTSTHPNGKQSLSGISLRAFALGTTLGLSFALTIHLLSLSDSDPSASASTSAFWRIPFFISTLSLFHFLEFYTTATYNPTAANISSYLLTSNGWAYNAAHGSAILECFITIWLFPNSYPPRALFSSIPFLALGLGLVGLGQYVRSLAMKQAAGNFNHHVQSRHKDGHVLVTDGVYGWLRHPSYFGFFWWGLGTQIVLGNGVCLVLYAVVLWRFFSLRIKTEENFLISFFGDDYVRYRQNTRVGIPGIP